MTSMEHPTCTTRCAWCGLIRYGGEWHPERRTRAVSYTHSICPPCRVAEVKSLEETLRNRGAAPAAGAREAISQWVNQRWQG